MPSVPTSPVTALMAMSETPKRMPAAAPSMTPWWWSGAPMRLPMTSRPPTATMPASKAIMPATEKLRVRAVRWRAG